MKNIIKTVNATNQNFVFSPVAVYHALALLAQTTAGETKKEILDALNLKEDEGKKILTELIKVGDVLVENYAPGTIEKLGFPYEKIKEINPRIIFAQVKGYSELSPYAN